MIRKAWKIVRTIHVAGGNRPVCLRPVALITKISSGEIKGAHFKKLPTIRITGKVDFNDFFLYTTPSDAESWNRRVKHEEKLCSLSVDTYTRCTFKIQRALGVNFLHLCRFDGGRRVRSADERTRPWKCARYSNRFVSVSAICPLGKNLTVAGDSPLPFGIFWYLARPFRRVTLDRTRDRGKPYRNCKREKIVSRSGRRRRYDLFFVDNENRRLRINLTSKTEIITVP